MKISKEFDSIIGFAREEAMRTGSYSIGTDHLLLGLLRHSGNGAKDALRELGVDPATCKRDIESRLFHEHSIPFGDTDKVRLDEESGAAVSLAIAEAIADGSDEAGAIHLLKAICKQEGCRSGEYLRRAGVNSRTIAGVCSSAPSGKEKTMNTPVSPAQMGRLLYSIRINTKTPS